MQTGESKFDKLCERKHLNKLCRSCSSQSPLVLTPLALLVPRSVPWLLHSGQLRHLSVYGAVSLLRARHPSDQSKTTEIKKAESDQDRTPLTHTGRADCALAAVLVSLALETVAPIVRCLHHGSATHVPPIGKKNKRTQKNKCEPSAQDSQAGTPCHVDRRD